MSLSVPESSLTQHQLATMANFRRSLADALDQALAEGGAADAVDAVEAGAAGDGATDDTANIQDAFDAAIAEAGAVGGTPHVHFPQGRYLITDEISIDGTESIRITGKNAVIVYESTVRRAFVCDANSTKLHINGVEFEGEDNDDYTVNQYAAIYLGSGATDVDIVRCRFTKCTPLVTESNYSTVGRLSFMCNRVFEAPNAISVPSYSTISYNWFVNEAVVETRSHMVYVFGPAGEGSITNNWFINGTSEDIQIRAGSPRYEHKGHFAISGNTHKGSGGTSVWIGSDDTTIASGYNVFGNMYIDVAGAVTLQGCNDSSVCNNTVLFTWEYANERMGAGSSAIGVSHGGPTLSGHMSPAKNVRVADNMLVMQHPWFGKVTFLALPVPGESITIGDQTYTWQAGAESAPGEVQIQATIPECISRLSDEIRGRGWGGTRQNAVLRDEGDVIFNTYLSSGAPNNILVVVSFDDFVLSAVGVGTAITAPVDNSEACSGGISATATECLVVDNNTLVDFSAFGVAVRNSIEPTTSNNKLVGSAITDSYNHKPRRHGNQFHRTAASDAKNLYSYRLLSSKDGFPIDHDNGLIAEQEYASPELKGYSGTFLVSDGKARTFLFYGSELLNSGSYEEPQSIPFRWSDDDTVRIYDGSETHTFTFKRTLPGAGEFNDAASLIALINATGTIEADFAEFTDVGSTPDPEVMIELKAATEGAAGNAFRLYVDTRSKTCGQILRNWHASEEYSSFYGGNDGVTAGEGATRSFVFSPCANPFNPILVQGVEAATHALNPYALPGNAVPGVGYWIEHDAVDTAAVGKRMSFALRGA